MEPNHTEELPANEAKKKYTHWDFFIGVVLGAFSIFIIIDSMRMPTYGESIYARPGTVPIIVGVSLLVLSFLLIVKSLKEHKFALLWGKLVELSRFGDAHRFLALTVATLIYVALLDFTKIHFIILTAAFLWVSFVFFKVRLLVSTVLSIVTAAAIYGFFTHVFTVPMP